MLGGENMTTEQIKFMEEEIFNCAKKMIAGEMSCQNLEALARAAMALAELHKC